MAEPFFYQHLSHQQNPPSPLHYLPAQHQTGFRLQRLVAKCPSVAFLTSSDSESESESSHSREVSAPTIMKLLFWFGCSWGVPLYKVSLTAALILVCPTSVGRSESPR